MALFIEFLTQQWPEVRATMLRLGLDIGDLPMSDEDLEDSA